jgi:trehalose 6-phosphate phosphatase
LFRGGQVSEETIKAEENCAEPALRRPPEGQRLLRETSRADRYLFDAWPEIVTRLRSAESRALLLDFDGTLVALRRRPGDVRFSERGKRLLKRLVLNKKFFVAVVSGRDLKGLETLVGVEGVHCVGLHGAEREGESVILSKTARQDLLRAKRDVRSKMQALPRVWIEEKGLSFAVHYRGARQATVQVANRTLRQILVPVQNTLRVLNGDKVWEVMPRELPGKGVAARNLLARLPEATVAMYFGDDDTDEEAFAVLPDQITVAVGRERTTRARFYLRSPAEVLQCLFRLERELT